MLFSFLKRWSFRLPRVETYLASWASRYPHCILPSMMNHTWQAMHRGTPDTKSPIFLLGNIPNPLTIFQIGCATFRRLFVIFRCSGCPADILIACTRQQYGILFRVRYGLGEIVLSLYIGYGSSISRHYFFKSNSFLSFAI